MRGLFKRKQKTESIIFNETAPNSASKRDKYQFDRYKVILAMLNTVARLQDTAENKALYQRLDACYYRTSDEGEGVVRLSTDELVLIRRLLGDDNGSIGAHGHQARVELDSILSSKGIPWRRSIPSTGPQQRIQGSGKYLRTHLEALNDNALAAPVITSLPDIRSLVSITPALSRSTDQASSLPLYSNSNIGISAFRCWEFRNGFLVSSGKGDTVWKEVMHSDKPPEPDNEHGLYGTKLSSYTVMRETWKFVDPVCGIIRLRGRIIEHRDGILRAESASIVRIFIIPAWVSPDTLIGQVICEIRHNYPNIPLSIILPEQLASILTTLAVRTEEIDKVTVQ